MNPFDALYDDVRAKADAANTAGRPWLRYNDHVTGSVLQYQVGQAPLHKIWEHGRDSAIVAFLKWVKENLDESAYQSLLAAIDLGNRPMPEATVYT